MTPSEAQDRADQAYRRSKDETLSYHLRQRNREQYAYYIGFRAALLQKERERS